MSPTLFRDDDSDREDRMARSIALSLGVGILAALAVLSAGGWFLVLRPLLAWYGSR